MMDTDVLFRDSRRFTNEFNSMPPLITNNSIDSTSSDGAETDTFSSGVCNWDYNNGLADDLGLLLDHLEYEHISEDFRESVEAWENSVKMEEGIGIDQKPLSSDLIGFEKENISIIPMVRGELDTPTKDTHFNLNQVKKENPDLPELSSVPFSDICSELSRNFTFNELPPHLDLCAFINGEELFTQPKVEKTEPPPPQIKAGRKKIDLKAQRYIIGDDVDEDEENIDVETVSENGGNSPVLEAKDLKSLLEQFEATEVEVREEKSPPREPPKNDRNVRSTSALRAPQKDIAKNDTKNVNNKKASPDVVVSKSKASECSDPMAKDRNPKKNDCSGENKTKMKVKATAGGNNNKQIIEALPRELIDRIKESGKRKRIAIIDPVPTGSFKKRKTLDSQPQQLAAAAPSTNITNNVQNIELDHNYCSSAVSNKKLPKKDSGYLSAEDEDKTLHNQPLVKSADGKLMVSLLKANTIRSKAEENKKKKLNIEEYKKRRMGILSTPTSSLSNSPLSSNCSSPLPEDENTRRLKHEEKLRKMALELLNTPPKSSSGVDNATPAKTSQVEEKKAVAVPVRALAPPPDMDVITYVSIGVNTEVSGRNPLLPVAEKLEEIKPLLKNASVKINSNSLISSLIENIPRAIKPDRTEGECGVDAKGGHGEDKTVIYLPKDRKPPECKEMATQTSITLLGENKRRYRRRRDSSSSGSSYCSEVRSHNGNHHSQGIKSSRSSRSTSITSSSSRSSIRTRSRSLSRSPSPQQRRRRKKQRGYDKEYVQEVEERRVVYVGKIARNTTKKDLQRRFGKFGPIKSISLHFRDHGYNNLDNYGFVTFEHNVDAYEAIEHGNDDPYDAQYDLSFGGRRLFCKTTYSDLDNMRDDHGYGGYHHPPSKPSSVDSFDRLLKEMQEKLKKRKV